MKMVRELVEAFSMAAAAIYSPKGFKSDRPIQGLLFSFDETVTSGTTGSGAWNQDDPWSILQNLKVWINGSPMVDIPGYFLAMLHYVDKRAIPWSNRTAWATSAALQNDMALYLDFIRPLKPGTKIDVQVQAGTVAQRVNTVTPTLTSSAWRIYQDLLEEVPSEAMQKIRKNRFVRSLQRIQKTITAASTGWDDTVISTGDMFAGLLVRQINNSLLSNALITNFQWEHEKDIVKVDLTPEAAAQEWVALTRQAEVTGYKYLSPDLDGDGLGLVRSKTGESMKFRMVNGAPTGTASLELLLDKWVYA